MRKTKMEGIPRPHYVVGARSSNLLLRRGSLAIYAIEIAMVFPEAERDHVNVAELWYATSNALRLLMRRRRIKGQPNLKGSLTNHSAIMRHGKYYGLLTVTIPRESKRRPEGTATLHVSKTADGSRFASFSFHFVVEPV